MPQPQHVHRVLRIVAKLFNELGPVHIPLTCGRRADRLPMNSVESMSCQPVDPAGSQVHIDDDLHGRLKGTSTSSERQAA